MIYKGKVVKVVDFGAFVNFFGPKDGLVHVSHIAQERVNHPSDYLKEGQEVFVKLMGFDDRGKVRLSMKFVDQETGEETPRPERSDGDSDEKPKRAPRGKKSDDDSSEDKPKPRRRRKKADDDA